MKKRILSTLLIILVPAFVFAAYQTGVNKIDRVAVDGLFSPGVEDSLAYKVQELEKHTHNREKWLGVAATPSGETHVADRMAGGISAFTLTAGNNDFGSWVQIMGSSDTPISSGMVKFDAHRFLVTSTNSTNPFVIQIATGESAGLAAKISSEEFTEAPYVAATNNNDSGVEDVLTIRTAVSEKVWARAVCIGSSGSTISFYYGIHEYPGI